MRELPLSVWASRSICSMSSRLPGSPSSVMTPSFRRWRYSDASSWNFPMNALRSNSTIVARASLPLGVPTRRA